MSLVLYEYQTRPSRQGGTTAPHSPRADADGISELKVPTPPIARSASFSAGRFSALANKGESMTITRRALHFPLVDTSSRLPAGLVSVVSLVVLVRLCGPGWGARAKDTWTCHSGSCSEATR